MKNLQGFWSYAHSDNEDDQGRILQLADDIRHEFQLVMGEEVSLFVDRDSIEWGQNWEDMIKHNLASAGFFIPVLTERYFQRQYCILELKTFFQKAKEFHLNDLLLPILYAPIEGFLDQTHKESIAVDTSKLQCEDWRDLRLCDRSSERYRRAVATIVKKLVDANKKAEQSIQPASVVAGFPEKVAVAEGENIYEKMSYSAKEWSAVSPLIINITTQLQKINKLATKHLDEPKDINSRRNFANALVEPTEEIWKNVSTISEKLYNADQGFRLLVSEAPKEIQKFPEVKERFCSTINGIRNVAIATHEANSYATQMIALLDTFVSFSRELRPVARRLQAGLTNLMELGSTYDEWLDLATASGIEC